MASQPLQPFLTYSTAVHVLIAGLVLIKGLPLGKSAPANGYTIDFVGPPTSISPPGPAAAADAAAPSKPAPQTEFDEFGGGEGRGGRTAIARPRAFKG